MFRLFLLGDFSTLSVFMTHIPLVFGIKAFYQLRTGNDRYSGSGNGKAFQVVGNVEDRDDGCHFPFKLWHGRC